MTADRMAHASLLLALVAALLSVLLVFMAGPAAAAVAFGLSASKAFARLGTKRPVTALVGLIVGALISIGVAIWFAGLVLLFVLCAPGNEC